MWFKQAQIFRLQTTNAFTAAKLKELLAPLAFKPCLPSMPNSAGWVSPLNDDDDRLTLGINDRILFCLQIEEKILPASVVNQTLKERLKEIEAKEARKIGKKEKQTFKDEVTHTLLLQAFTKMTRLYAYIDIRNKWLVLGTLSASKTEQFMNLCKKVLGDNISSFEFNKPSALMTRWLKEKDYPSAFGIERACILQDPNQQNRIIRCQHQDLFASSIQALLKDGCDVISVAMSWHDKINFVLTNDFTLRNIHLTDIDISETVSELESRQQKFEADFMLMGELFAGLYHDLLAKFSATPVPNPLAIAS